LIGSPHHAFLMARLAGRRLLWINALSLVVNLLLAAALIPLIGAWGATISCAAGMILRAAQLTIGEARAIGVNGRQLAFSVAPMAVASIIATSVWLASRSIDISSLVVSVIGA